MSPVWLTVQCSGIVTCGSPYSVRVLSLLWLGEWMRCSSFCNNGKTVVYRESGTARKHPLPRPSVRPSFRPFIRSSAVRPSVPPFVGRYVLTFARPFRLSIRALFCPSVSTSVRPCARPSVCPSGQLAVTRPAIRTVGFKPARPANLLMVYVYELANVEQPAPWCNAGCIF